jgi:alkylation response protein AidB-like acyl-CoA dehydrogenase
MDVLASERSHGTGASRALERRIDTALGQASDDLDRVAVDRLSALAVEGRAYLALARRDDGAVHPSLGKLALSEYHVDLAECILDNTGARGMLDGDESRSLIKAPGSWFGGGTTQVQRNIIGERVLGLPREPRS